MTKKTIYQQLRDHLAASVGDHNRIAKETGIAQATISRIHLGKACPTLHKAQPLLDYFDRNKRPKKTSSAVGLANARGRKPATAGRTAAPLGE